MSHRIVVQMVLVAIGSAGAGCGGGADPLEPKSARQHSATGQSSAAVIASRSAEVPSAPLNAERIVFVRAGSVWMMGPDGEDPEQLTVRSNEAADQSPQMSPDGTHLVYASAKDGTHRLYLQAMDDMIPDAITSGIDAQPSWSPDGKYLAFMRGDERVGRDLYIVQADGQSEPRLLLKGSDDHPERAGAPAWGKDGSFIILSADRREHKGTSLWRVEVESGEFKRLTPAGTEEWVCDKNPSLSPNGSRIVFASNRHASSGDSSDDFDIYTVRRDGSGLLRLTDDPGTIANPVYSTDGARVYFASTRIRISGASQFEWELFVMASGGGAQRRLTRDARPENSSPSVTRLPGAGLPGSGQ